MKWDHEGMMIGSKRRRGSGQLTVDRCSVGGGAVTENLPRWLSWGGRNDAV